MHSKIPYPNTDKTSFLFPNVLRKISGGIVLLLLLFLPFQFSIYNRLDLPGQFLWTDEIFIVTTFILFLSILLYQGKIKREATQILFCLLILGFIGIISALYNRNSLILSANGIFDYIKNFLAIPVFCVFAISKERVINIYKLLHKLALFLCFVAVLQMISFYLRVPIIASVDIRFGLPRVPSLMGHPNIFGLYALLFFILDFALHRRVRWQNLLLATGVVLSISRMVWVAFFISSLFLFIQGKSKKTVLLFILVMVVMALAIPSFYLHTAKELKTKHYFRGYALSKSLEIWKEHPFLGVGPGMYGGVVSFVFNSPIYKQYDFSPHWFNYMSRFRSLDQFWPQILVEMGLLGTFAFLILLYFLWKIPWKDSFLAENLFRKRMLTGFSAVPIVLFIYLSGSGLNLTAFLLTYGALFGMVLGMKDENPAD